MRSDEVTHAAKVQNSAKRLYRNSRCSRDRQKDIRLTEGALEPYELRIEKSRGRPPAGHSTHGNERELLKPSTRGLTKEEGPNIYRPENFYGIYG